MKITKELCMRCKGRLYCGLKNCPLLKLPKTTKLKENFQASSVNLFIGRFNYPNVRVGPICAPDEKSENSNMFENHKLWIKNKFTSEKILDLRMNCLFSHSFSNIYNPKKNLINEKFSTQVKEISLSSKPLDSEITSKKIISNQLNTNIFTKPMGSSIEIKKLQVDNPKVPRKIDYYESDPYVKSQKALEHLRKRFDHDYLTKVFSYGNFGLKAQRKLVPTRWSITAVDDIIAKDSIKQVLKQKQKQEYYAYYGGLYGNLFLVLLISGEFSFELFECVVDNIDIKSKNLNQIESYTHDYENVYGRKEYAKETAGGYYASKKSIAEFLEEQKRQAKAIVIRFITPAYKIPLGVFVVRESVKKALNNKIYKTDTLKDLLDFSKEFVQNNIKVKLDNLITKSKIIESETKQKKIKDFF